MSGRKGEMPIPYIIALILGVIVLGLLAYWLYTGGVGFDKTVQESTCRTKVGFYCSSWKTNSYQSDKLPNNQKFSAACRITSDNKDDYYAPDCCSFTWAQTVTAIVCQSLG
jgi:hypothetical protein